MPTRPVAVCRRPSRPVQAGRGRSSPVRRRRDRIRAEEGKPRPRSPAHGWRAGNATEVSVSETDKEKEDKNAKRVRRRALNDAFRKTFRGGRVVMTSGVNALAESITGHAFWKMKSRILERRRRGGSRILDVGARTRSRILRAMAAGFEREAGRGFWARQGSKGEQSCGIGSAGGSAGGRPVLIRSWVRWLPPAEAR